MANEFKHLSIGGELTQAEYEAVGGHVLESQAIGDIIYATSTSQLSRLGIGSTGAVLTVTGGVPAWDTTWTPTGHLIPASDDSYDLGSSAAAWQDLFLEGDISLTDAGSISTAAGALTIGSAAAINITPTAGSAILLDGTISIDAGVVTGATSITSTAFAGALTGNVTGNASGTAATVTSGTQAAITTLANVTTVGALDAGSITSGFTSIDVGAGAITTTGALSIASMGTNWTNAGRTVADMGTVTTIDINGGTINGITDLAVVDGGTGASTLNNLITMGTHTTGNYVATVTAGTGLTSDGATSGESVTHSLSVDASQGQITTVGALASGTIADGFGTINNGSNTITTTGLVSAGSLTVTGTTTLNGNLILGDAAADTLAISATIQGATPLVFEGASAGDYETSFAITNPSADRTITFPDATLTVNAAANISGTTLASNVVTSSLTAVGTIGTGTWAATDVGVAYGGTGVSTHTDHGVLIGQAGDAIVATSAGTSGQVLTSGGSGADPDWADAVAGDITNVIAGAGMTGGATSGAATLNVIGGTGITANADEIVITPAQTTITSIYATDLIIGEDAQTAIDFGTENEIDFKINNATELTLSATALYPVTDAGLDLGTSGLEFKDAFFDGTVTSDAFAGPLTGAVTGNADTATALASGRTIAMTGDVTWTSASFTGAGNVTGAGTIADNAVTLAKMAGGTDGNIISYDASGDPVAVATGTDGQVLTSAGAGAPPAFEDAGGGTFDSLYLGMVEGNAASSAVKGFTVVEHPFGSYADGDVLNGVKVSKPDYGTVGDSGYSTLAGEGWRFSTDSRNAAGEDHGLMGNWLAHSDVSNRVMVSRIIFPSHADLHSAVFARKASQNAADENNFQGFRKLTTGNVFAVCDSGGTETTRDTSSVGNVHAGYRIEQFWESGAKLMRFFKSGVQVGADVTTNNHAGSLPWFIGLRGENDSTVLVMNIADTAVWRRENV